jgi:dimethylamine monooxygenase subunit A
MTLGFTVEELGMAGRGGGALRMGLSRVAEDAWLFPDPDRAARAAAFDADRDAVMILPEAGDAAAEAAAMIGGPSGLEAAARACWEDLCLLQSDDDGATYRLTGGAVAFPTDWRLADKIGQPLTRVHQPIHGYAEQLSAGVDHFMRTLAPGPIFGRANWFVVASDDWAYLPDDDPATRFAHVDAGNAGRMLYLRCERQTLRRLPATGAILFTIGIALAAFDTLSPALVRRIADALAATPEGEHARRAAPHYIAALTAYAAMRDHPDEKAA